MPIEILSVTRVDGRSQRAIKRTKKIDTLATARLIMDETTAGNGRQPCPADELALMILLEGHITYGLPLGDIVLCFAMPQASVSDLVTRAEKTNRVVRVKTVKNVYVRLSARGIQERKSRRGNR
jgi:hypothetical protein